MIWDQNPILVNLGPLTIRWYGFFFATGVALALWTMGKTFRDKNYPESHLNVLSLLLPFGLIVGAHLIHLAFYEPRSFIDNPKRILQIGSGLASHGGMLGTMLALWLFCWVKKTSFLGYADAIVIGAPWPVALVRVGNFFNSEIVGAVSNVPWAVEFKRNPFHPGLRHPSQIYEAAIGFALFGLAWWLHKRRARYADGQILAVVMSTYFVARFFVEFVKERQVMSPDFPLSMGQLLSVPCFLFGVGLYIWAGKRGKQNRA